jgi:hypothetical protein
VTLHTVVVSLNSSPRRIRELQAPNTADDEINSFLTAAGDVTLGKRKHSSFDRYLDSSIDML